MNAFGERRTKDEADGRRVALFLRANAAHDDPRQALQSQRESLLRYCGALGWSVVAVYEEVASTASRRRPALQDALAGARRGDFDVLLVRDFARLARHTHELLRIVAELHVLGVSLHVPGAPVGTGEPFLRMVWEAMIAIEEELRRSRLAEGRRRAAQRRLT